MNEIIVHILEKVVKAILVLFGLFVTTILIMSWWTHRDDPQSYYPCRNIGEIPFDECVSFYINEKGWTFDEIVNGLLIDKDGNIIKK